jgi:hypothetical protein
MEEEIYTGAIPYEHKPNQDFIIATSGEPFDWEKGYDINFPLRATNQFNSYACGGFMCAYGMQVKEGKDPQSQKFIYAPTHAIGGGTAYEALGNWLVNKGSASESLCPSFLPDGTTNEAFITRKSDITQEAYDDAKTNKIERYAKTPDMSIDEVAKALRDNRGLFLGIYGQDNGTWRTENPLPPKKKVWAHWVFAVGAGMYKGKKAIKFINSWGNLTGDNGYQWVTEDYFPNGIFLAWTITANYIIPKYVFTKAIKFGEKSEEVKFLQMKLETLGHLTMPKGVAYGYFGPLTAKAVFDFQIKNHVASLQEIQKLGGKLVGPATRKELNK